MSSYGLITKSYVSAVDPMVDTREINKKVTDVYNEDALTDILNWADRKQVITTGQPVYYTFINESLFKLAAVDSVTSGNGSTLVTIVLTAATSGQIKVQDLIKFTDNNVGIVRTVTTSSGVDTVVIKSVSGANIAVTAADQLSIFSVAMGENSDVPAAERFGLTKYSNKYQIFSISSKITDVQNAATLEVEFEGQPKWIVKDHLEKKIKLKGMINAAFIGGQMSVTSFSDTNPILTDQNSVSNGGGGGAVQTTRGVDNYIELYGTTLVNGTLGTFAKANLDNACDVLTAQRAPTDYLVVGGDAAMRILDTYYKALGSSGVQSVRLVIDGNEIDFNVNRVKYGKYTFNYAMMPILDHPTIFSQTVIAKSLYYIPYNNQVKVEGGGTQPAIQCRYIPNPSPFGSDMIGESYQGALNPFNPVGTQQAWITMWTARQGLECLGVQHFLRQQVK